MLGRFIVFYGGNSGCVLCCCQPGFAWVLYQEIHKEIFQSFVYMINFLEILLILGKEVELPNMGSRPSTATGRSFPGGSIHKYGSYS